MSHIYDEHETIGVLRWVVAQKGAAYVYERQREDGFVCVYWDRKRDCPSCLVGHVLAHLGFTVDLMIEGNSLAEVIYSDDPENPVVAYFREKFTAPALRLLGYAQDVQDLNGTWGTALRSAEAAYEQWTTRGTWPVMHE